MVASATMQIGTWSNVAGKNSKEKPIVMLVRMQEKSIVKTYRRKRRYKSLL